jgi:hypothetical protein
MVAMRAGFTSILRALQLSFASDDGATWMTTASGGGSASNSQCSITPNSTVGVTFKPGFAGTKTIFVEASNGAGFDTGDQPLGGWTVQ